MMAPYRPQLNHRFISCLLACMVLFSIAVLEPEVASAKTREAQLGDPTDTDPGPAQPNKAAAATSQRLLSSTENKGVITREELTVRLWLLIRALGISL